RTTRRSRRWRWTGAGSWSPTAWAPSGRRSARGRWSASGPCSSRTTWTGGWSSGRSRWPSAPAGVGPPRRRGGRAAVPSGGAGGVADPYNLLGHALGKALSVLARQQGRGLADVAADAGAPLLAAGSLKAALDLDWDDPAARAAGLARVLAALEAVEACVAAS